MSFTVFLGNLPIWVTADDIKQWLSAEDLVADSVKVIRNHETQESKGFAFIEAPTSDEMQAIIRRFDRAPLEDKVLRANPAQPSKGTPAPVVKGPGPVSVAAPKPEQRTNGQRTNGAATNRPVERRPTRKREQEPKSAFATELAKVL
jgi:RNA recognition motif-containing protein